MPPSFSPGRSAYGEPVMSGGNDWDESEQYEFQGVMLKSRLTRWQGLRSGELRAGLIKLREQAAAPPISSISVSSL